MARARRLVEYLRDGATLDVALARAGVRWRDLQGSDRAEALRAEAESIALYQRKLREVLAAERVDPRYLSAITRAIGAAHALHGPRLAEMAAERVESSASVGATDEAVIERLRSLSREERARLLARIDERA